MAPMERRGNGRRVTASERSGGPSRVSPSVADAERAAAVLAVAGVSQVMLFGSVALGEQTPGSDIDLVAIYDDLDYQQRHSLEASLGAAATEAAGYRVEVLVTDRPEWERRTSSLETSMERHIASYGRLLVDQPPGEVNHSKEMVLATLAHPTRINGVPNTMARQEYTWHWVLQPNVSEVPQERSRSWQQGSNSWVPSVRN